MDVFHALEVFVKVATSGSFSAAGRQLNLGQPAVSKVITALEERVGARLLVRTTRKVSLTEAGTAYLERVVRALHEAEEAEIAARGAGTGLEGRLKVCGPVTFTRMYIVPRLEPFLAMHPKLKLELMLDDRHVDLIAEGADLALRFGTLTDSSMVSRKIVTGGRGVYASAGFVQKQGMPSSPRDLERLETIGFAMYSEGEAWRFKRGEEVIEVRPKPRIFVSAAEGLRETVKAGLGVAVSSHWLFGPEVMDGRVVRLLADWQLPAVDLWCIYPAGRLPTAKARAFTGFVEGLLKLRMGEE